MSLITVQHNWPRGFKGRDAVVHYGKNAHVIDAPPELSDTEHEGVPIMYDDKSDCFLFVHAGELQYRFR